MESRFLEFSGVESVRLLREDIPTKLPVGAVQVRSEYTFISAGTELANFTGKEPQVFEAGSWCAYPWRPGYAQVGIVEAVGEGRHNLSPGDRVYTLGNHAEVVTCMPGSLVIPVPDSLEPLDAVASRMAGVAASAFVASPPVWFESGWTLVFGLGMVGNLAAQCIHALGHRVIGVDPVGHRRELAQACGITRVLSSGPGLREELLALTGGEAPQTVIEATGLSGVAMEATELLADHGHLVLLGSPRVPLEGNITALLSEVHLRNLNIHGALEWSLPLAQPEPFNNPSVRPLQNLISKQKRLFNWIEDGRLSLRPLISHVVNPDRAEEVYQGLLTQPDRYTGVAFDWRL
ncbi:MAG: zinc-binding dehydrogenase [Planctomycetota bacterium]|jgi:threonine dehydrogenase-like Zn-dependent dehydrogenase